MLGEESADEIHQRLDRCWLQARPKGPPLGAPFWGPWEWPVLGKAWRSRHEMKRNEMDDIGFLGGFLNINFENMVYSLKYRIYDDLRLA